jgi:hypothetical protein
MAAPSLIDEPAHWRQRAEEARREAEELSEPSIKHALMDIAAAYDRLAAIMAAPRKIKRAE